MSINDDLIQELDEIIQTTFVQSRFPGLALAIVNENGIIYEKVLGYREIENKKEITPETLFPIASVSKSFCGYAFLKLVHKGVLDLSTPISNYLPEWDYLKDLNLNVHQILTHTTGFADLNGTIEILRHHTIPGNSSPHRLEDPEKFREYMSDIKNHLVFDPDTVMLYNNDLYIVLGLLIEEVTGKSYGEYVTNEILHPLGMKSSVYDGIVFDSSDNHVTAYTLQKDEIPPIRTDIPHFPINGPGGGCFSTLRDLSKYLQIYLNEDLDAIIPRDLFKKLFSKHTSHNNEFYGYGWYITTLGNEELIAHGGNLICSSAWIGFLPKEKLGVVLLHNSAYHNSTSELPRRILSKLTNIEDTRQVAIYKILDEICTEYVHYSQVITAKVRKKADKLDVRINSPLASEKLTVYPREIKHDYIRCVNYKLDPNQKLELLFKKNMVTGRWGFLTGNVFLTEKE